MTYAHLPNTPHIDRVLAHVRAHPEKWTLTRDAALAAAQTAARGAAWDAARGAAWDATRDAAWDADQYVAWDAAWAAVWGVVTALIAWDDASAFLDQDPDDVCAQAAAGNPAAILMLPAVLAMPANKAPGIYLSKSYSASEYNPGTSGVYRVDHTINSWGCAASGYAYYDAATQEWSEPQEHPELAHYWRHYRARCAENGTITRFVGLVVV
jgi:hypothetical protein